MLTKESYCEICKTARKYLYSLWHTSRGRIMWRLCHNHCWVQSWTIYYNTTSSKFCMCLGSKSLASPVFCSRKWLWFPDHTVFPDTVINNSYFWEFPFHNKWCSAVWLAQIWHDVSVCNLLTEKIYAD